MFLDICQDRKEMMEDDDEIIGSSQVAAMFVDWTDPLILSQAMLVLTPPVVIFKHSDFCPFQECKRWTRHQQY